MAVSDTKGYPVSHAQKLQWLNDQVSEGVMPNNSVYVWRIEDKISASSLIRAYDNVIARHPILRTTFKLEQDDIVQYVNVSSEESFKLLDASRRDKSEIDIFIANESRHHFSLEKGPLIKANLIYISEDEYIFMLIVHKIIFDTRSLDIFLYELGQYYHSDIFECPPELPTLKYIYAERATKGDGKRKTQHYELLRKNLKELETTSFFMELDYRSLKGSSTGEHNFTLDKELIKKAKKVALEESCSLKTVILSAFLIVLYRYSNYEALTVAYSLSEDSNDVVIERAIGNFTTFMPLPFSFEKDLSFRKLLFLVKADITRVKENSHITSSAVPEEYQENSSDTKAIPYCFTWHESKYLKNKPLIPYLFREWEDTKVNVGLFKLTPYDFSYKNSDFGLELEVAELEDRLYCCFQYKEAVLQKDAVTRMEDHLKNVLEEVLSCRELSICEISLLSLKERRQLLIEWNGKKRSYQESSSLNSLFEEIVQNYGDMTALITDDERLDYYELNRRANHLAAYLLESGIEDSKQIGIYMLPSSEMIVSILAVLKTGAAYVPLDPLYPLERIEFIIKDAEIKAIVSKKGLSDKLTKSEVTVLDIEQIFKQPFSEQSIQNKIIGIDSKDSAYIIYTSGSTGTPKGVECTHRGVVNLLTDFQNKKRLSPGDRCSLWTSFNFDVSLYEIFSALTAGGTLYIAPNSVRMDSFSYFDWIAEQKIQSAYIPPFMLKDLNDWLEKHKNDVALERVLVGVEPISHSLLVSIIHKIQGLQIINGYGPTEAAVCATLYCIDDSKKYNKNTPIGRPIQNSQVYILDKNRQPLPIGVAGELYIGGHGLSKGYINEESSKKRFIPDPFSNKSGGRLYKTGDIVRWLADGNIEFVNRVDKQVKIRGYRVEPGEIEANLKKNDKVNSAIVTVDNDSLDNKRLIAYIVTQENQTLDSTELRSYLSKTIPHYMIPSLFIFIDNLPTTINGKIDYELLPKPKENITTGTVSIKLPTTEIEERLLVLWQQALGLKKLSVSDNFFQLGGNSLQAAKLIYRIKEDFKQELSLSHLFDGATIETQAEIIDKKSSAVQPPSPMVKIQPRGERTPFFAIHPIGGNVLCYYELANELGVERPFYGLQSVFSPNRGYSTIEDMANKYIQEIQKVKEHGPYYIGGWSSGGVIAFEIGRRLMEAGEEVSRVTLFDTAIPIKGYHKIDDAEILADFARNVATLYKSDFSISADRFREVPAKKQYDLFMEIMRKEGLISEEHDQSFLLSFLDLYKNNMIAENNYRPSMYKGKVLLLRAEETHKELLKHPKVSEAAFGWQEYVSTPIEIKSVAGNHWTMMYKPHVPSLAQILADSLT